MNPLFKRLQRQQGVFFFFDQKDYLDRPQRSLRGFISRSENIAHPIFWRTISPRDAGISVLWTASSWLLSTCTAGIKKKKKGEKRTPSSSDNKKRWEWMSCWHCKPKKQQAFFFFHCHYLWSWNQVWIGIREWLLAMSASFVFSLFSSIKARTHHQCRSSGKCLIFKAHLLKHSSGIMFSGDWCRHELNRFSRCLAKAPLCSGVSTQENRSLL